MATEVNPPAGWYQNPQGAGQRYWDGEKWTDNFAPGQATTVQVGVNPGMVMVGPKTNGMAIASLVLGIIWLYGVGSVLALIFGLTAQKQIDESGGTQSGRGMATAGVVLGAVGIVGALIIIVILVAASGS